jgi:hemerythrin superfamily protein
VLKQDHAEVRALLKRLQNAADRDDIARAADVLAQVDREVKIHSQIEEEVFYPAFKDAARTKEENKLFFEAKEEHHVVDMVLPEVSEGDNPRDFAGRAKVLKDLIEHHADEEEKQMFPKAKKLFRREELLELGRRLEERKRHLKAE